MRLTRSDCMFLPIYQSTIRIKPARFRILILSRLSGVTAAEAIRQALSEDEREDDFLVFRSVLRAADAAGGVPDPGFERFAVGVHGLEAVRAIELNTDYRNSEMSRRGDGSIRLRATPSRVLRILLNCREAGRTRPAQAEGLPHCQCPHVGNVSGIGLRGWTLGLNVT
jgi:hypothetical protein